MYAAQREEDPDVLDEDHQREGGGEGEQPDAHQPDASPGVAPAPDEGPQEDRDQVVATDDQPDFEHGRAALDQLAGQRRGEVEETGEEGEGAEQGEQVLIGPEFGPLAAQPHGGVVGGVAGGIVGREREAAGDGGTLRRGARRPAGV